MTVSSTTTGSSTTLFNQPAPLAVWKTRAGGYFCIRSLSSPGNQECAYSLSAPKHLIPQRWYTWSFTQAGQLPAGLQRYCPVLVLLLSLKSAVTSAVQDWTTNRSHFWDPLRWKALHMGKLSLFVIILSLIHFGRQMCILSPPPENWWNMKISS